MSFFDRLLESGKTATGETDDNSVKGEEDIHQEQEDSERPSVTPPSHDIDPRSLRTQRENPVTNTSLPRGTRSRLPLGFGCGALTFASSSASSSTIRRIREAGRTMAYAEPPIS